MDIEEVEMTEEEFIEELALEIVEELLEVDQETDENYLKELVKEDISQKIAAKFIDALDEEEIPEGISREFLSDEVGVKLVSLFKKKLRQQMKKGKEPIERRNSFIKRN